MDKVNKIGKRFILVFGFYMVVSYLFVYQSKATPIKRTIVEEGVVAAYGNGFEGGSHRSYRATLFILHIGFDAHSLLPSLIPPTHRRLLICLEPQYNIVTHPSGNYEFGIGIGFEYRFPIVHGLYGYLLAGSGLHYISFDSSDQSGGFNFNDNLGAGVYIYASRDTAINAGFRFRHISNADLNMPNEGINSYLFVIGVSRFF